jgi:hypothetical protein
MNEPRSEHPQETPTERAEVLVDQWGERVGRFLSSAGYQLRKAAARAREEAEDIWAEAQTIRHNSQPQEKH